MKFIVVVGCLLALGACDSVRTQIAGESQAASSSQRAFEYRIVSIDRNVMDLSYSRSRSVSFTGKIEFSETGQPTLGNAILYARLRTETAAGTDENELLVLIENGRGEYEGSFRYLSELPMTGEAPELRTDQVTVDIIGVIPIQSATLSRVASASAPAAEAAAP